jgi:manganese transport protein
MVSSRDITRDKEGLEQACRFFLYDTVIALNLAFFVNAAILIGAMCRRRLPASSISVAI